MRLVSILCLIFAVAQPLTAQKPVAIPDNELRDHALSPRHNIHTEKFSPADPSEGIALEVVVSPNGVVESAHAIRGQQAYYAEAERIEMERHFKPFTRDGVPVKALIHDYVGVAPPEKWSSVHASFPEIKDWNSLRIALNRTRCFGTCPAYTVVIHGDGSVDFNGKAFVMIVGNHHAKISTEAVHDLVSAFRRADYFSLNNEYATFVTDCPSYTTSISFDGVTKSVQDYMGTGSGMPEVVGDLEEEIDTTAHTAKWIQETSETWPSLVSEHWDLRAASDTNSALFAGVVAHGSDDLIKHFVIAGAPVFLSSPNQSSPFEVAAGKDKIELVRHSLRSKSPIPKQQVDCGLQAAAGTGDPELTQLLLDKGADVNAPACGQNNQGQALIYAARSGNAEVVEQILRHHALVDARQWNGESALFAIAQNESKKAETEQIIHDLVDAGANVNLHNDRGETAIFLACQNWKAVRPLVESGASLNLKDKNGNTAMMGCVYPEYIKAMIEAGADPTIRDKQGQTASQKMRHISPEVAGLLEAAERNHSH